MKYVLYLAITFFGVSCAVGPLYHHESAKTLGKGNHDITFGYGKAGYLVKWNAGIGQNFDLGLQAESLSLGIKGKYAFLNPSEGLAFSTALGTGSSLGGDHYHMDFMFSSRSGMVEPYANLRFTRVKTDKTEFTTGENKEGISFKVDADTYDLIQPFVGTIFWLSEFTKLSVEASTVFSPSADFKLRDSFVVSAGIGFTL